MATRFVMSAPSVEKLPDLGMPEFALTGRSNVGKSSLIASLVGQSKLVRVSRTPGRTQLLNVFVVDERWVLMDLPGYGYAKLSHSERERMNEMVNRYMAKREALSGVIQILDARRETVTEADLSMASWVLENNRPLLLAITKADLIPKNRRMHQLRAIEKAMGVPSGTALMCSGKTGEGRLELITRLQELIPA